MKAKFFPRVTVRRAAAVLLSIIAMAALLYRPAGAAGPVTVLVLGDSLAAGQGLSPEEAFPAVLEGLLQEKGVPVRVINAGVSGDTTADGLARLDWALAENPDIVVLELGGNDALRGRDPARMEADLTAIITRVKSRGMKLLLTGMRAPESYGPDYAARFNAVFPRLAGEYDLPLMPFVLEGVALDPELNQADGIHPNARGAQKLARNVFSHLIPLLEDQGPGAAKGPNP